MEITLDGYPETLRYTPRAMKEVNTRFGSFNDALTRIGKMDFLAFVLVVAAGTGKSPKEVEDAVFEAGMHDLIGPLSDYLIRLSNGGKPLEKDDKKAAMPGEA